MPLKIAHAVKLIPILISGTFTVSNSFLPPPPGKAMSKLLAERRCYVAAEGESKEGSEGARSKPTVYLLACRTVPVGKTLHFFFFNSSEGSVWSERARPVKHLKSKKSDSGGKSLTLDFTWGDHSSLEIQPYFFDTPWLSTEPEESGGGEEVEKQLVNFCQRAEILGAKGSVYKNEGEWEKGVWEPERTFLQCFYKNKKGGEGMELWKEYKHQEKNKK